MAGPPGAVSRVLDRADKILHALRARLGDPGASARSVPRRPVAQARGVTAGVAPERESPIPTPPHFNVY